MAKIQIGPVRWDTGNKREERAATPRLERAGGGGMEPVPGKGRLASWLERLKRKLEQ